MAEKRKKFEVPEQAETGVRINKYLGDAGVCSRREADTYIKEGKVTIDGQTALMGSRVMPGQVVMFNGKPLERQEQQVLIAFYKPVGIVCTTDTKEPDNVIDFINYGKRIYPIGRLDKDSEGLLLLTNDGDIVNKILRAGNHHEKEYLVTVNKPLTPEFLRAMESGVPILDTVTKPCKIEPTGKNSFKIILTQGLNRQIRRMCEYLEYRVISLKRVRIMHITLGRLNPGTYRNLTPAELSQLREVLKDSSKLPAAQAKQEEVQKKKTEPRKSDRRDTRKEMKSGNKSEDRKRNRTGGRLSGKTDRKTGTNRSAGRTFK